MNQRRIERLQALIRQRVAEVVDHELADPNRGFVTITRVALDKELQRCTVYWSVLGDEKEQRRNERMLDRAAPFVQREIAAVLHTRNVPRVRFQHDESLAGAERLESILDQLRRERGDAPPPPADLGTDAEGLPPIEPL